MKITKYGSFQFLVKVWNIRLVSDLKETSFKILYGTEYSLIIPLEVADHLLLMSDDLTKSTKYSDTLSTLCAKYLHRQGVI